MAVDLELVRTLAREMHGRSAVDDAILKETAERINSFLGKARLADESLLAPVAPAISFDPAAPTYRTAPIAGEQVWSRIAGTSGGTGYGGAKGTTGVTAPPVVERPEKAGGPEYLWWSATDLAAAIRRRELSPVEVTRAALERIDAVDPALNAFVTVMADSALAQARLAEADKSPSGALHGVPLGLKDLYETAGVLTTGGSRILSQYVPKTDATAVTRLKAAGAIILGKTATHEFAFGPTTDSPFHGPTHNPWDLTKVPAGSSGGSAAAVAGGIVPIGMGTDTGGSIRMPSSVCNLVGLKPTYGRCSKAGILPLSWSLDHPGPIVRTVKDAALLLSVIAGPDPLDPSALPVPLEDYVAAAEPPTNLKGIRIGIPKGWLEGPMDSEVEALFGAAAARFGDLGAELVAVDYPPADVMTWVNRLITLAEVSSIHATFLKEHAADYAPDVRLRMELGSHVLARDYLLGLRVRGEIARIAHGVMSQVDALLTPTLPIPAATIGQSMWTYGNGGQEPVAEAMVRFTAPFSVTGQPAFSLPAGFTAAGLPVGVQLVGRVFGEAALIRIAAAFEKAGGPWLHPVL